MSKNLLVLSSLLSLLVFTQANGTMTIKLKDKDKPLTYPEINKENIISISFDEGQASAQQTGSQPSDAAQTPSQQANSVPPEKACVGKGKFLYKVDKFNDMSVQVSSPKDNKDRNAQAKKALNNPPLAELSYGESFQTDYEGNTSPFWEIDLLKPYPLEKIIVYNRQTQDKNDLGQAKKMKVWIYPKDEEPDDYKQSKLLDDNWILVYDNAKQIGDKKEGVFGLDATTPLSIGNDILKCQNARFIRLQNGDPGYLWLARIDIKVVSDPTTTKSDTNSGGSSPQ